MPTDRSSTFTDLFAAWSDMRENGSGTGELAEHHTKRYAAFSRAFGVDLGTEPTGTPPVPGWAVEIVERFGGREPDPWADPWHLWVHGLALRLEECGRSVHSPFSRYLEAPRGVIAANARFGEPIARQVRALRGELFGASRELLAVLFPEAAGRTVTADELRACGHDPSRPAPDPDDYW